MHQRQILCRHDRRWGDTPQIGPGLPPFPVTQIPHSNSIPAERILRLPINHLMRHKEQFGMQMIEMVHARNMQGYRRHMQRSQTHNPIGNKRAVLTTNNSISAMAAQGNAPRSNSVTFCPSEIRIERVRKTEQYVRVIAQPIIIHQPAPCKSMLNLVLIFTQT